MVLESKYRKLKEDTNKYVNSYMDLDDSRFVAMSNEDRMKMVQQGADLLMRLSDLIEWSRVDDPDKAAIGWQLEKMVIVVISDLADDGLTFHGGYSRKIPVV